MKGLFNERPFLFKLDYKSPGNCKTHAIDYQININYKYNICLLSITYITLYFNII